MGTSKRWGPATWRLAGLCFGFCIITGTAAPRPAVAASFQAKPQASQGLPSRAVARQVARHKAEEGNLRQRATELYGLMQVGRWDKAESYISPDSRESFRKQQKGAFLSFKIDSVEVDPGGQSAAVQVEMQVVGNMAAPMVPMAQTSHWVLADDQWYMVVPEPRDPSQNFKALFSTPQVHAAPHPEDLKFKGRRYVLGKIQPGEIKVAHFPFTNVSDHLVTLSSINTGCPCLQAKTAKTEFKPGESASVDVAFNPEGYELKYEQTIVVKTEPGNLASYLTVVGFVMPPEAKPTAPPSKTKPGP